MAERDALPVVIGKTCGVVAPVFSVGSAGVERPSCARYIRMLIEADLARPLGRWIHRRQKFRTAHGQRGHSSFDALIKHLRRAGWVVDDTRLIGRQIGREHFETLRAANDNAPPTRDELDGKGT